MSIGRLCLITVAGTLVTAGLPSARAAQKPQKEPKTQTLQILPEPPPVATADVSRLVFRVAPLSPRGLLSKQVLHQLRALQKLNRQARVVQLRAFVAGTADTRRVRAVVSEFFTQRHQPLPVLSVIGVGRLPVKTAQVVIESVAETRKTQNPAGLAFIAGQVADSGAPVLEVAPLAEQSLDRVAAVARKLGLEPAQQVLRVTCYCSSLDDGDEVRRAMIERFPRAALNYLQLRRVYTGAAVTCEAVARLQHAPAGALEVRRLDGLGPVEAGSHVALFAPGKVAFTGTQLAFRFEDSDVRLAFERLGQSLKTVGSSLDDVAVARFYTLSLGINESIRKLRGDFFHGNPAPVTTMVRVDTLPSLDASFALDVIAVPGASGR